MKKMLLIVTVFLLWNSLAPASQITGEGYGETPKEAKKESLADLSQRIQVEVKSEFSTTESVNAKGYDKQAVKIINLKSELPLIGVDFNVVKDKSQYYSVATLDYKSKSLYIAELTRIRSKVDKNFKQVSNIQSNEEKSRLLNEILTEMDQYNKYRIVAQFLGNSNIPEINTSKAKIRDQLARLGKKADTIDFGIRKITKIIKIKNVYIYPPTTKNTSEITEFGSAIKDRLSVYLNTVRSPKNANYFITGEYQILKNGIDLTLHILDVNQNTIDTVVTSFLATAYKNYKIEPKTVNFDKLLRNGVVVSSDFRVCITTSLGKRDLLFKDKDEFKILVKMNKPGYFYLISHKLKENDNYSYLVDFFDSPGNRKFIYFINADDVNKWVELGEFEVVPPFGVESIQMIASTADLIDNVPANYYDQNTKLYKIGNDPSNVINKTRSFIRKNRKNKENQKLQDITEDFLLITTLKK